MAPETRTTRGGAASLGLAGHPCVRRRKARAFGAGKIGLSGRGRGMAWLLLHRLRAGPSSNIAGPAGSWSHRGGHPRHEMAGRGRQRPLWLRGRQRDGFPCRVRRTGTGDEDGGAGSLAMPFPLRGGRRLGGSGCRVFPRARRIAPRLRRQSCHPILHNPRRIRRCRNNLAANCERVVTGIGRNRLRVR